MDTQEKKMIHIQPCSHDTQALENLTPQYAGKVVPKPWGWEFLIHESAQTATWYLRLTNSAQTSMHCHRHKKTTLLVLSGCAVVTTFRRRDYLKTGDTLVIAPKVFHSSHAPFAAGAELLEIETPVDKHDLVRMVDQYDRESSSYEQHVVSENLGVYNHFTLSTERYQKFGEHTLRLVQQFQNPYPPSPNLILIPLTKEPQLSNIPLGEPLPSEFIPLLHPRWSSGVDLLEFR